jgi:16S rRNA (adenine1518-N6/adenine1519-N6)-dimethyltransferase
VTVAERRDAGEAVTPRQASLRRLREFGVRPNRELGQNFLIDDNLLGVIGRAAELARDDVVLEVGGGLGVLSEHLAPRVSHVHVVEVDAALEPALRDAAEPFDNVSLHFADAVRLDLAALHPAPTKVVANLPYGVAATVILRAVAELPRVGLVVAMVQREVAARLAAPPGSKTYGATSVLAQLSCEVRVERRVPASVFHPAPRVESAIVVLRRTGPPPPKAVIDLVHAAFAHRRKALAGSLALAPGAEPGIRERTRAALEELGHAADARAERLSPGEFLALAEALAGSGPGGSAGPGPGDSAPRRGPRRGPGGSAPPPDSGSAT